MTKAGRALVFMVFGAVILMTSTARAAEPILIRFSHVVGENTPKGIGAKRFKELAEQRLPGRVNVEIFPRAEKYDDEQVLLALLFGDVELAAPSFVQFEPYARAFEVFDLPFLFEDVDHVHRFQASEAGRALPQSIASYGFKGLGFWDNGMRVLSANRPIRQPADAAGLEFRLEPSRKSFRSSTAGSVSSGCPFRSAACPTLFARAWWTARKTPGRTSTPGASTSCIAITPN